MKSSKSKFRTWANKNDGKIYRLPENPVLTPLEITAYAFLIFSMLLFLVAEKLEFATRPYAIGCFVVFVTLQFANAKITRKDDDGGTA